MMAPADMRILALMGSVVAFGSERANLEALNALRDAGAKVLLIVSDAPYAGEMRDYAAQQGFDMVQAPYIRAPRPYTRSNPLVDFPVGMARAAAAFFRINRDFRATHIHAGNQLYVLNFMLALALTSTRLVYRCGDAPSLHNAIWRMSWRFISRRATRLAAVSRYIAERMVEAGTSADKITVVYSRPPRRTSAAVRPKKVTGFNIGYVGQVIESKGVAVLAQAFEQVAAEYPKARLLIAGNISEFEGESWGKAFRTQVLANPALAGRVEFEGFVEDIPAFLTRCAITVAPTLTEEPMGNVVMEAKQAGLASIIFRSGGFPEVIEHGVTGYVCAVKTADCLAEALRSYLADTAAARRQGEAARESLASLGVDRFDETWQAIYAKAAA